MEYSVDDRALPLSRESMISEYASDSGLIEWTPTFSARGRLGAWDAVTFSGMWTLPNSVRTYNAHTASPLRNA